MNKFLTNLEQTFSDDEKAVIKNKLENILGTDQVKMAWYPSVGNDGTIQWGLSAYSTQAPNPANIKGPQGLPGKDGEDGKPGTSVTIENIETITGGRKVIFSDGNEITIYDGKDGAGVAIKGTVDNVADLPSTAENGDAYIVNNDDGKLYVYANGWPTSGVAFTGPKGADGDTPTLAFIENSEKTGIDIFVNGGEEPVNTIPYATDGHSPVITTSATSTGNDIYIDGTKAFSVTNGTNGTSGKDGYTPSLTISSVTSTEHTAGGTELKFTYPESWQTDVVFTAWNGNDGKDWDGTTGRLIQGDFIKLTPTGDDLEISVTGDFVTSSTIVGTDQYALTTAGWAKVQGGGGGSFTGIDANAAYFSGNGDTTALDLNGDFVSGLFTSASLGAYITSHSGNAAVLCKGYNIYAVGAASDTRDDEPYADAGALTAIILPGALTYYTGRIGNEGSSNTSAYVGSTIDGGGWKRLFLSAGSATKLAKATPDDAGNTFNFIKQQIHSSETTPSDEWENDNTLHFILE